MTNRLDEIKKSNPLIAEKLEELINSIASIINNLNYDEQIKVTSQIINLKEKISNK